jgi:type IV pilus assembly protein PilW
VTNNIMHTAITTTISRQRGMTLIETMVAMTISSILILGSIQMYAQARSNYRTTESVARMQENLRFSIDILDDDVRLAGFWGKTNLPSRLAGQGDVTVTCNGNNVTNWVIKTNTPINALQQESELLDVCPGTNPREKSDILIVRHATVAQDTVAQDGVVQLKSNGSVGAFFDNGIEPGTLNGQVFDVEFNAYYISNESKYDLDLPSLRRLSLVGNRIEDQEIIPGVENLQVQFGIDSTDDGNIYMYVNGDDARIDTSTIIATRLWLLVRSEQNEAGQGYEDNKGPYESPDASIASIDPLGDDAANYPPTFRRMALSRTIVMRNRISE